MIYILALVLLILIGSITIYLIRQKNTSKLEIEGDDFEIVEE